MRSSYAISICNGFAMKFARNSPAARLPYIQKNDALLSTFREASIASARSFNAHMFRHFYLLTHDFDALDFASFRADHFLSFTDVLK